jgi:hypothetical protein
MGASVVVNRVNDIADALETLANVNRDDSDADAADDAPLPQIPSRERFSGTGQRFEIYENKGQP